MRGAVWDMARVEYLSRDMFNWSLLELEGKIMDFQRRTLYTWICMLFLHKEIVKFVKI